MYDYGTKTYMEKGRRLASVHLTDLTLPLICGNMPIFQGSRTFVSPLPMRDSIYHSIEHQQIEAKSMV